MAIKNLKAKVVQVGTESRDASMSGITGMQKTKIKTNTAVQPATKQIPSKKPAQLTVTAKGNTKSQPKVLSKAKPATPQKSKSKSSSSKSPASNGSDNSQVLPKLEATKLQIPLDEEFHRNITKLLQKTDQPGEAENYGEFPSPKTSEIGHLLLVEEEQHLADHIAFLAQTKSGPETVSAVTLEEGQSPPSLKFRLASNRQRSPEVIEQLRAVLQIVEEYARIGVNRDTYHSIMLKKVLHLSRCRLYARITESRPHKDKTCDPLYIRISSLISSIQSNYPNLRDLYDRLCLLRQVFVEVSKAKSEDQAELLEKAVLQSYQVSNIGSAKSLESYLEIENVSKEICKQRIVSKIDMISKYLQACDIFMRFGGRPKYRALFSKISLEYCTPYPATTPRGARLPCYVHGEVQLVVFYALYPPRLPPRAIGSSKDACFLCDLFLKKHGDFRVSGSHKKLYDQWTIPEVAIMNSEETSRFEAIKRAMNKELVQLIDDQQPGQMYKNVAESRTRLLILPPGSGNSTPISKLSSILEPTTSFSPHVRSLSPKSKILPLPQRSAVSLHTTTKSSPIAKTPSCSKQIYFQKDLPIRHDIHPLALSFSLLVGAVDYIFDVQDVQSGALLVEEATSMQAILGDQRLDIRHLSERLLRRIEAGGRVQEVVFYVHDTGRDWLKVMFVWGD